MNDRCSDCRYFREDTDGVSFCYVKPPQLAIAWGASEKEGQRLGWVRPICHPDDPRCSLFEPKEEDK